MKPCLKNRRVIEVPAGSSWKATLKQGVYSCPNTKEFDFVLGATALVLKNSQSGAQVPLEVCAVIKLDANELESLNGMAQPFRGRAEQYLAEAGNDEAIIRPGFAHRCCFLSTGPWPDWLQKLTALASDTEWAAILSICAGPDQFLQWPQVGELLWPGCVRTQSDGQYIYPPELIARLARLELKPGTRTNGPAILAFLAAGGIRPACGNEGWHIHHIYDGTGSVNGISTDVPHAVRDGNLFTHSAGLVAAHPVAHQLAHQSDLLKWLLRREAFLRFGFDPMGVFVDQ
jgi:hypothetical protein